VHGGFGYDPVFVPEDKDKTFAELSAEDKNLISHRGRAIKKLSDYLNSL
jgi:XTP/dITP diphosphohydrolase